MSFKAGEYEGLQKTYGEDGSPESEETWSAGKLNGVVRLWENKILTRELWYKDGRLDGNLKIWWPNGKPKAEMAFQDGRPNGMVRNYDDAGVILQEGEYFKGAKNGKQRLFEKGVMIHEEEWALDQCKTGCATPSSSSSARSVSAPATSSSANKPSSSATVQSSSSLASAKSVAPAK